MTRNTSFSFLLINIIILHAPILAKAGIGVAMVGAMPSVGLYFGIYSYCKKTFHEWDPDANDQRQTLYIALSAAIGNTIASASRVPYEVLVSFQEGLRYSDRKSLFWSVVLVSSEISHFSLLLSFQHRNNNFKPGSMNRLGKL